VEPFKKVPFIDRNAEGALNLTWTQLLERSSLAFLVPPKCIVILMGIYISANGLATFGFGTGTFIGLCICPVAQVPTQLAPCLE